MSFDIEYDEKGNVKSPPPIATDLPPEEPVYEDVVEELPEPAHAAPQEPTFEKPDMQKSFSDLRRAKENAERERDEYRRMFEERNRQSQMPPQPEEDLSYNIQDDDLVEGRTLSKVDKKIRRLEQEIAQQRNFNQQIVIENKLKAQYPDFDSVVSRENVDRLESEYPEILYTLRSGTDLYAQGVSAYTMIKKLGIVPDDGLSSLNRIKSNTSKPRTATSIQSQKGDSPLTKANPFAEGLTEELKAQLLKDMNAAIRNKR